MTSVVYNTMPTPSHYDSQYTAPIPVAITDEMESTVVHGRLQHNGVVSVSGANVIPFCQTVVLPGLQRVAHQIRKLSIDFGSERPTHSNLEHLSAALEALPNCTNLTLLGLPSVEYDGWVLRNTTFSLTRLVTNLSLTSKDVIDFLRRQPALAELSTTSPPPHLVQPRSTYAHFPFPHEVVPNLHTLDCPAPFLFSLQVATPPTRPLMNMRLDLNRLNSLVEIEALTALATYSATVERLSLRRSVLRTSPALDSVVALNMASVISRVANKRQWSKLKFLEMRDGMYDSVSIPRGRHERSEPDCISRGTVLYPEAGTSHLVLLPKCRDTRLGTRKSSSGIHNRCALHCVDLLHVLPVTQAVHIPGRRIRRHEQEVCVYRQDLQRVMRGTGEGT